jgi:hypothetical protein
MSKNKLSTSTIINNTQELVPWLASSGPLSYSPKNPPDRDYYFQYSWIIPDIFNKKVNKREHRWFGENSKDDYLVKILFNFWHNARSAKITQLYFSLGNISQLNVLSPVAIYEHKDIAIIIQHGSYQFVKPVEQPFLKEGFVLLYRGIGNESTFKHYKIKDENLYLEVMNIHSKSLIDSVVSFNAIHSNVKRCESAALNHDTYILHHYAEDIGGDKIEEISSILNSGYSLYSGCGERKFGPSHVVFKTPVTNVRITTFFCGESEVKVIDPNKLEIIKEVGCRVETILI